MYFETEWLLAVLRDKTKTHCTHIQARSIVSEMRGGWQTHPPPPKKKTGKNITLQNPENQNPWGGQVYRSLHVCSIFCIEKSLKLAAQKQRGGGGVWPPDAMCLICTCFPLPELFLSFTFIKLVTKPKGAILDRTDVTETLQNEVI